MAAIVRRECEMRGIDRLGQQGDMADAQTPFAYVAPGQVQVEIDSRLVMGKAQEFFDRPLCSLDPYQPLDVAVRRGPLPGLGPFAIGALVLTRRLEHAVAGVPVGLQ